MEQITKYIYRIDLDLTGLCNKTCSFCPRSNPTYPNVNEIMSFKTIEIVLEELRSIDFKGFIELAGRGEPTTHPKFEKVIDLLTQEPRKWKVRVTTNGYRIKKHWSRAYTKIDELILNTYTNREEFEERLVQYRSLANGTIVDQYFKPDGLSVDEINKLGNQNDVKNEGKQFRYAFNNRAGWFSDKVLDSPCWHPMRQIFIDYKGNYQMCCNDWKYQIKIGNIHERSLMDMYVNDPKLNRIRWSLINNRRRDILPCASCDDGQGGRKDTMNTIEKFRKTPFYRQHVAKIAGEEGLEYIKELRGGDLIPVYQEY